MGFTLFHGRQLRYRFTGWVADFCPICRSIRPFWHYEVEEYEHVNFIPIRKGIVFDAVIDCHTCRFRVKAHRYETTNKTNDLPVDDLLQVTNPHCERQLDGRLELERKLLNRSLGDVERRGLIVEPFQLTSPIWEERAQGAHFTKLSGGLAVAGLLVPAAVLTVDHNYPYLFPKVSIPASLVFAGACFVVSFLLVVFDPLIYKRRKILPWLTCALRPLEPTLEELTHVVSVLCQTDMKLA
jgi:hypothetical protein